MGTDINSHADETVMESYANRVIPQIDRAVPLKVRACEGTSEGSLVEVFMLEHALCL